MYACEILELVDRCLALRDAQLVLELARRSDAHAEVLLLHPFLLKVVQRVRAAGVGPHIRERDLLCGALLEKELAVGRAEHKGGERPVQEALVDVLHEMAYRDDVYVTQISVLVVLRTGLLVHGSDSVVLLVYKDAPFVHESRLLGIVAGEVNARQRLASGENGAGRGHG